MARNNIPLPGQSSDYNSKKSRGLLVNLMVEQNNDGSFRCIKRREGLSVFATAADPVCSNIQIDYSLGNISRALFATTSDIVIAVDNSVLSNQGAHGIADAEFGVRAIQNTTVLGGASTVQTLFYRDGSSSGSGSIYDGAITAITDPDFTGKNPIGGEFLSNRFIFADRGTDSFFLSDPGDGFVYDPLSTASADESPGTCSAIRAVKSNAWIFTESKVEYWQNFNDPTLPLRRVQGASLNIGLNDAALVPPIDKMQDYIGFVGNDYTVRLIEGSGQRIVSDLDFSLMIMGDGTDEYPAKSIYPFVSMIDGNEHKYLVVTSFDPAGVFSDIADFTWVYDITTGESHYRKSPIKDHWDMYYSSSLTNSRFVGSSQIILMMSHKDFNTGSGFSDPNIYRLESDIYTDDGEVFECILQTGSVSFDQDVVIEYVELEMETGVGNIDSPNPLMTVEYTKDGGSTWTTWGTVELGASGEGNNRVRMNSFGRLVRHRDFIMKFTVDEPVRLQFYGAYAEIN